MPRRVVCVKWGRAFGPEWVNRLRRMVARHTTLPHSFECLTDDPEGLEEGIFIHPTLRGVAGKSNKIALFQDGLFLDGDRVVFLDLDTLIVGNIDRLLDYRGRFAMLADFRTERRLRMSGVMAWRGGFGHWIWDNWNLAGRPNNGGSDQVWIRGQVHGIDALQDHVSGIVSYKYHKLQGGPRVGDRIVCFHNRPKNADFPADHWVTRTWKGTVDASGPHVAG